MKKMKERIEEKLKSACWRERCNAVLCITTIFLIKYINMFFWLCWIELDNFFLSLFDLETDHEFKQPT